MLYAYKPDIITSTSVSIRKLLGYNNHVTYALVKAELYEIMFYVFEN